MFNQVFLNKFTTQCEYIKPNLSKKQNFTVVYTHGFCSDPWGLKPLKIKEWCEKHGVGFFRFELVGHGINTKDFEMTTIDLYKQQLAQILTEIISEDVVLVGSSLGGWLSLLTARDYPSRVKGFIGLAAAPDFLKDYIDAYFKPEHKDILQRDGKVTFPTNDFTYIITKEMIASAYPNLLLDKPSIELNNMKVRLIQGMRDASLNWKKALEIANKVSSQDVKVSLIKEANHRLGDDESIKELEHALDDFLV